MQSRFISAILAGFAALGLTSHAAAQQGPVDVTFAVPLNLTRLDSGIPKVRVNCRLSSSAIIESINVPGSRPTTRDVSVEIPVSQGSVVQTVQLLITLVPQELNNPSGRSATYECVLQAYDPATHRWNEFADDASGTHRFATGPVLTPAPQTLSGQFVW